MSKRRGERRPLFPYPGKGDQEVWWAATLCFCPKRREGAVAKEEEND